MRGWLLLLVGQGLKAHEAIEDVKRRLAAPVHHSSLHQSKTLDQRHTFLSMLPLAALIDRGTFLSSTSWERTAHIRSVV